MRVIQLTVQMLEETHTAEEHAQPSQLKGRMLFMSTHHVINWARITKKKYANKAQLVEDPVVSS